MKERIEAVCDEMKEFLVSKNQAYGNSAADPVRIFSKATPEEALLVRIDDKLSRLARGSEVAGDDTIKDLAGYLLLLMVVRAGKASAPAKPAKDPQGHHMLWEAAYGKVEL